MGRIRMASEIDALAADLDNANATIDGMLKKEKAMQRTIDEINLKLRDAQNELEASQREYKKLHGEHLGLRKAHEDALGVIEGLRRDLKHAQDEIAELGDALRAKEAELEKMRRDLLREMEQIQSNLEIEIKLK